MFICALRVVLGCHSFQSMGLHPDRIALSTCVCYIGRRSHVGMLALTHIYCCYKMCILLFLYFCIYFYEHVEPFEMCLVV